jgi:hypothetical protein
LIGFARLDVVDQNAVVTHPLAKHITHQFPLCQDSCRLLCIIVVEAGGARE